MPVPCIKQSSLRHGFMFDAVPTILGCVTYASDPAPAYGAILDSAFEMADAIATSNGVPPASALAQVMQDEGWRILPRHRREILARLEA
jgi:hypothetical protein